MYLRAMIVIGERINVGVEFALGKVTPRWFEWKGREYLVKRVPMVFERQDGGRRYLCFSVDTGGMLAELTMCRDDFNWLLTKTSPL